MDKETIDRYAANKLSDRNRNISEVNSTDRSLCGQLMLVSTVALTGSLVFIGNIDALSRISSIGEVLLIFGIFFILVSIASGVKNYFLLMDFFKRWATVDHKNYHILNDLDPKEYNDKLEELNNNEHVNAETSEDYYLRLQVICLGYAAVFILAVIVSVMFDFGNR